MEWIGPYCGGFKDLGVSGAGHFLTRGAVREGAEFVQKGKARPGRISHTPLRLTSPLQSGSQF